MREGNSGRRRSYTPHTLLAKAVFGLDRRLQHRGGVFCYTSDPKCIFRLSLTPLQSPIMLSVHTVLPAGAVIAELHLWNEQLPVLSEYESLIAWGLSLSRVLAHSLRLLSAYLAARHDCDCVGALRADMSLGTPDMTCRLLSLSGRYGFAPCCETDERPRPARRLGENILISMLALARDTSIFRLDMLRRDRVRVFMTRADLDKRFGKAKAPSRLERAL